VLAYRTLAQMLVALAPERAPEMCRLVAAAGMDLQRVIEGSRYRVTPGVSWTAGDPRISKHALRVFIDSLRSAELDEQRWWAELDEHLRRLRVELLRRLQSHAWPLTWLHPEGVRPFPKSLLGELTPEMLDPKTSEVIFGGTHYLVRVEIAERPAPRKKPGRPPKWLAVMERMRPDLKQQTDGEWKLVDENGRPIMQINLDRRYNASRTTCVKALAGLMTEIRKSADRN
jgi:hypothetical protein